ncbi:unnamed protein product [Symbiodinium natans]|uniref:Sulfotransferase family protein n=1 Tax=Symbiodinium natans TaxID=878477 RepID=A0A812UVL1_9DINO|nr:unnamed protein product [Symbiodinium natans]
MAETLRIHLLSGPRNISTALMYSFAQRADTTVVDEPLYAHYLKVTGLDHPGRDEVLAVQENDGQQVVDKEVMAGWPRPVVFFKHIAKQFIDIDPAFLLDGKVLFLIREPDQMLSSFIEQVPNPTLQETALKEQWELAEWLQAQGQRPLSLLLQPEETMTRLCAALGISFDPAMLHWEAGARPEDGIWAPYWYSNVHKSTGFGNYKRKEVTIEERLQPLLAQCKDYYQRLAQFSL